MMATKHRPGVVFVLATFVLGSVGAILVSSLIPGAAPSGNPDRLHREVRAAEVTVHPTCAPPTVVNDFPNYPNEPCTVHYGPTRTPCPTSPDPALIPMQTQTSDDFGTSWTIWGCPYFATATP